MAARVIAIITLLFVVTISLIVTRVGAVALRATGLSQEVSAFQARSAFSGVGFTTTESETVVNHPVRRRIILWLILLGNAGVVTTIASLLLGFTGANSYAQAASRGGLLILGIAAVFLFSRSRWIDRAITSATEKALRRWTYLDTRDYAELLNVGGHWNLSEIRVQPGSWLTSRSLRDLALRDEGKLVLGFHRGAKYSGAPSLDTKLQSGDAAVFYGRDEDLVELAERPAGEAGDLAHMSAVKRQQDRSSAQTD